MLVWRALRGECDARDTPLEFPLIAPRASSDAGGSQLSRVRGGHFYLFFFSFRVPVARKNVGIQFVLF